MKEEDILAINIKNWFNYEFPQFKADFHHVANERVCDYIEGRKLKRMGVTKGFTDFILALPMREYHGLFLEIKTLKGILSTEQIEFMKHKNSRGYLAKASWGFEESKKVILDYIKLGLNHD